MNAFCFEGILVSLGVFVVPEVKLCEVVIRADWGEVVVDEGETAHLCAVLPFPVLCGVPVPYGVDGVGPVRAVVFGDTTDLVDPIEAPSDSMELYLDASGPKPLALFGRRSGDACIGLTEGALWGLG